MIANSTGKALRLVAAALAVASFAACSGGGSGSSADAAAAVVDLNRAPVAATDRFESTGGAMLLPVMDNDTDPDGDALSLIMVGSALHGSAALSDAGTPDDPDDDYLVYTPAAGYAGEDRFSYTVSDSRDGRASGAVEILAATGFTAVDRAVITAVDTSVVIPVLDGPATAIVAVTTPAFGSAVIDTAGTPGDPSDDYIVYLPIAGFVGSDTFFYTLTGPNGTDEAAITVTITPGGAATPTVPVGGQVVKGLVRESLVRLYELGPDGQRVGAAVAAATTDMQGRWSAALSPTRGDLLVVASGGLYEDETRVASTRIIELEPSAEIVAVLPADDDFVVSSVYSHALYLRARHAAGAGGFASAYASARATSLVEWGFDVAATATADPALPDPSLPGLQRTHAMALGGAANALEGIVSGLDLAEPDAATLDAIVRDLADCTLDGSDFDGPIEVPIDGLPVAIVDDLDLNLEILRFRNNNFAAYSDTPLAVWDRAACVVTEPPAAAPPVVTVDFRRSRDASPELTGAISDPAAVVQVSVGGASYPARNLGRYWRLPAGQIAPTLTDGVYDVVVTATGLTGLVGADSGASDLVVDATAPSLTLVAVSGADPSPALSGSVDDPAAAVVVTIDGVDYPAGVSGAVWSLPAGAIVALADGEYAVTVTATDSFGNVGVLSQSGALTVSQNDPPAFTLSGDIVVDEDFAGARLVDVTPVPVPPDEVDQTVLYRLNPQSAPFADISISPTTGRVVALAVPDLNGSQVFTIIADDGQPAANFAAREFTLTVNPVNDPPAFAVSGDIVASENFGGTRQVIVTPAPVPADETGQTVTYSLSPAAVPFANVTLDPASGTVSVTAFPGGSGSQTFTLTADDGQGVNATASATFDLTVEPAGVVNAPPTTSGLSDVSVVEDAPPVVLDLFAAFDDAENSDAELTYTLAGNTNAALFDATQIDGVAGSLTLDFAADTTGSATLTVRATDTAGDWVETSFEVTVKAEADLRIAAFGPDDPAPGVGREVDFTLVLQNAGPSSATDVVVGVPLPSGYTYVTANNPGEYNSTTGEWYRSAINGTATLVLTVRVENAGPYDLKAEVLSVNEPDPDSTPGNGDLSEDDYATTSTSPRPVTDLALNLQVDDPIPAPGANVVLTLELANLGPVDTTGITVTLPPLPGELSYQPTVPSHGSFNPGSGEWTGFDLAWSGDPLLPLTATLTVTAQVGGAVAAATVLAPTATVTALDQLEFDGNEEDSIALLVLDDGLDHEWVGGAGPDPTDWHNPANWDSGLVPSPGDNVDIPATGFDPVLNADALSLAKMIVRTGAQLSLNGFTLSTVGDLDAGDGPVLGPGLVRIEFGKVKGSVPDLEISLAVATAEAEFSGDTTVAGNLTVSRGRMETKVHTITVAGDLLSTGDGILIQKDGPSEIVVAGDARFEGADYSQRINGKFPLRNGELHVGGDFVQTGDAHAFAAEDKHLVILNGTSEQTVYFQDPDFSNPGTGQPAAFGSRFANLRIDKHAATDGPVTLLSDAVVLRTLKQPAGGVPTVTAAAGSGHVLTIGGMDLDTPPWPQTENIVLDNVPLHVFQGHDLHHMEGLIFRNMDPAAVQLHIERRAFGGPDDLVDTVFETLPDYDAGGRYILFDNIHPDPTKYLSLTVLDSQPGYGLPMTEVIGTADIVWGTGFEDTDRDGLSDADEYVGGANPVFADSDGDGIDDPAELLLGTDVMNADTDGDGIGDGAELAAGGDPTIAAAPGTILYVRPAPLGSDSNSGFGGWTDALATNAAVEAALMDGAGVGQPFYVLYEAGTYAPLEIDSHNNVGLVGSVGPDILSPAVPPRTVFDAVADPDTAVLRVIDSDRIFAQSVKLTGGSNFAGGAEGGLGGGLFVNAASTLTATRFLIEGNAAENVGGGAYVDTGGQLDLIQSWVRRNLVPDGGTGGGGVAALGGLMLLDSVIADNRYEGNNLGGGGLYIEPAGGPVTVRETRVLANYSATSGGGMLLFQADAPVNVFNNLISGNAADSDLGGGIFGDKLDRGFPVLIESNTVAFNRSIADADAAGGIHLDRADNVELRDNVVWYNVDGDTVDELQDQFRDESGAAYFEHNSLEDFGPTDIVGNDDANPKLLAGFYLADDSGVVDTGSRTADDAGLTPPYTTRVDGAEDTGTVDRGYHAKKVADGAAYALDVIGEMADCATDTLNLNFVVAGVGGDLRSGHVVAVRQGGDDTAGGNIVTHTGIEVYGWADSQLVIDRGGGVYGFAVEGVAHGAAEVGVYEIKVDNDVTLLLNSGNLTTLFALAGC